MTNNKVLILDNEEMVLETIEMFYPAEDIKLFTASSLTEGLSLLEQEKPSVVVANSQMKEAQGRALIQKIRERHNQTEIVFMSDINFFKDTLAEFGKEISDVVYKPIDMDILEMIIKRAQKMHTNRWTLENFEQQRESLNDENSNLKSQILELSSKLETLDKENQDLKQRVTGFESTAVKEAQEVSEVAGKKAQEMEQYAATLQKNVDEQKNLNVGRMTFVVAMINALRKSVSRSRVSEIFTAFEEALVAGFKVQTVKIMTIDPGDTARVSEFETLLKKNQLSIESENGVEIPVKIGASVCSIRVFEKINVAAYSQLIYLFKELLAAVCVYRLTNDTCLKQLENEKKQTTAVNSIFANLQMYFKKSLAQEKIADSKKSLLSLSEGILNLVFAVQDEVSKLEGVEPARLEAIQNNLNTIVGEKAQNFDIISQKLAQVEEMVTNIQLGLEGKRMQQVSGDQYLFSKDRKQV